MASPILPTPINATFDITHRPSIYFEGIALCHVSTVSKPTWLSYVIASHYLNTCY
jgi:hypothetical protein